jgi:hypothetical protein
MPGRTRSEVKRNAHKCGKLLILRGITYILGNCDISSLNNRVIDVGLRNLHSCDLPVRNCDRSLVVVYEAQGSR